MQLLDLVLILAFLIVLLIMKWPLSVVALAVLVAVLVIERLIRGEKVFPARVP